MSKVQAFILTCDEDNIKKPLRDLVENTLNLYSVDVRPTRGGSLEIFSHTPVENEIFDNIQSDIDQHQIDRVVLINHTDCAAYTENDPKTHEIHLRHAVSHIQAKFPQVEVEAYLINESEIKKVI